MTITKYPPRCEVCDTTKRALADYLHKVHGKVVACEPCATQYQLTATRAK